MKADFKRGEDQGRSERLRDCLDAMNRHRANAGMVAGLLEYCDGENIEGVLVVEAGMMIREELEEVRTWTQRLEKELHR